MCALWKARCRSVFVGRREHLKARESHILTNEGAESMEDSRLDQIDTGSMQEEAEHFAGQSCVANLQGEIKKSQKTAPLGSWELDVEASAFAPLTVSFAFRRPRHGCAFRWEAARCHPRGRPRPRCKSLRVALRPVSPSTLSTRPCGPMGPCGWSAVEYQVVTTSAAARALVGTTCDITEEKLTHQELRASEEKYLSFASVPDVLWTSITTGNPVFVSPNCARVYGFTPEETCEPGFFFSRPIRTRSSRRGGGIPGIPWPQGF